MTAARTVEPVLAIATLWVRQALLLAAFRTLAIHFLMIDIVIKQQPAQRTDPGLAVENDGFTTLLRTDEHRPATAAVVFSFFFFLTNRALFHSKGPQKPAATGP